MKKNLKTSDILRERWLRGRLNYKLHAGQRVIEEHVNRSSKQLFVGEISRQFGKSYWLVKRAIENAITKSGARIKYATAFLTDLEEFILPAFSTILEDCPKDLQPSYKSQKSKFVFENGSEIKLIGLDRKPNGLRGNAIDLIILDESAFMSNLGYIYKSVIIPATTHRPDCKILIFSTPPSTPAHEFLDYVQKAQVEGSYCKLTIYDNPLVDGPTIKRLMNESGGENSTTWRREYLCEHITDANLAIIGEWEDEYVQDVKRDETYSFYHKYVSMDLGVKDHTAAIFAYYNFRKSCLVVENELVVNGPELTTQSLQKEIKQKEIETWGIQKPYLRVSDNNNPLLLQDLSYLHDLHFIPTDKGRLEEMVNTLKIMVRSSSILVHPRCVQMIGCLKYGVWDKNRVKFSRSNTYGHFDALAALIYLVRNLNKVTNPIPVDFQVDRDNQMIIRRISNEDMNIKKTFG